MGHSPDRRGARKLQSGGGVNVKKGLSACDAQSLKAVVTKIDSAPMA
jgi:hypothetical protein